MKQRIAKIIAHSGISSRRDAEKLIESGAVAVNGVVVETPATLVDETDSITVNGKNINISDETELYIFYKPINIMTTANDPQNRKTIYDILPDKYKHLRYVGRLDYKTTGLLLLTNDGDLVRKLTLPVNKITRSYIARVGGVKHNFDMARRGMTIDGINYRPMEISELGDNKVRVTITEGKKNEVRIVLRACGAPVQKLHRESFGNLVLGKLKPGEITKVAQKDIDELLKTL